MIRPLGFAVLVVSLACVETASQAEREAERIHSDKAGAQHGLADFVFAYQAEPLRLAVTDRTTLGIQLALEALPEHRVTLVGPLKNAWRDGTGVTLILEPAYASMFKVEYKVRCDTDTLSLNAVRERDHVAIAVDSVFATPASPPVTDDDGYQIIHTVITGRCRAARMFKESPIPDAERWH